MPADDYTPTTEQVRRYWQYGANAWMAGVADDRDEGPDGSIAAEFDRWLAAHDARVRRDAAREALAQEPTDGEQAARFAVADDLRAEGAREALTSLADAAAHTPGGVAFDLRTRQFRDEYYPAPHKGGER